MLPPASRLDGEGRRRFVGEGVVLVGCLVVVSWRGCCFVDVVRGFDSDPLLCWPMRYLRGRLERYCSAYKRALPPVPDIADGGHTEPDARPTEFYHCHAVYSTPAPSISLACYIYMKTSISKNVAQEKTKMRPKHHRRQLGKRRRSAPFWDTAREETPSSLGKRQRPVPCFGELTVLPPRTVPAQARARPCDAARSFDGMRALSLQMAKRI